MTAQPLAPRPFYVREATERRKKRDRTKHMPQTAGFDIINSKDIRRHAICAA
jgi:hypothetical protein